MMKITPLSRPSNRRDNAPSSIQSHSVHLDGRVGGAPIILPLPPSQGTIHIYDSTHEIGMRYQSMVNRSNVAEFDGVYFETQAGAF
jgi:hypothetical protein